MTSTHIKNIVINLKFLRVFKRAVVIIALFPFFCISKKERKSYDVRIKTPFPPALQSSGVTENTDLLNTLNFC